MRARWLVAAALVASCARPHEAREARITYNAGLDLRANQHFDAAVRSFTEARAAAAGDDELRYRAAFELASTLVAWADDAGDDAETAAGRLRQAAAWFGDAARLRPGDEAARENLQVVVTRLRELGDKLTAGERSLDKRLARVLADQRRIRDQLRQLDAAVASSAMDPTAVEATAVSLETTQRTLNAEVSAVGDLAAGERAELEGAGDDPKKAARVAQLSALLSHIDRARAAGGEVRAAVRRSLVPRATERAEAAVNALVRAADQLLDPGSLIRGLLGDQALLTRETRVIEALESGTIELGEGGDKPPEPPPHLQPERLASRQTAIAERTGELAARLGAAAGAEGADDALVKASPFVNAAVAAMKQAATAITGEITSAPERQREAMTNLARALEYFANVRGLIELTYAEQKQLVELLGGDDRSKEVAERVESIATLNRERLERLSLLLSKEREAETARAGDDEEAKKAIAARYQLAEQHRAAALDKMGDPAKAGEVVAELEELRRLFFSVIEHLKDLHRRQGETRDRTAAAQGAGDDERAAVLGEIASAETEHLGMGRQIAEALATQADQAQASPGGASKARRGGATIDPDAGEKLGAAADEVRQAAARMEAATSKLGDAASNAGAMSVDLEPPLADQAAAIEHLARAIQILEPPEQKQQNKDQQQQQQQQQDQQKQDQQQQQQQQPQAGDQDLSQNEVDKRLRAIREREAERRRQRRNQQQRRVEVDRDW